MFVFLTVVNAAFAVFAVVAVIKFILFDSEIK